MLKVLSSYYLKVGTFKTSNLEIRKNFTLIQIIGSLMINYWFYEKSI